MDETRNMIGHDDAPVFEKRVWDVLQLDMGRDRTALVIDEIARDSVELRDHYLKTMPYEMLMGELILRGKTREELERICPTHDAETAADDSSEPDEPKRSDCAQRGTAD